MFTMRVVIAFAALAKHMRIHHAIDCSLVGEERNLGEHGSHGFSTLEGLKYSKEMWALIKAWIQLV
jgi:hypothetical protein